MTTFTIGGDLTVRRLGFGAMRLPTEPASARDHAITVARRAVELGINLIDTAFMYGWGAESRPSHRRDGAMSPRFRG